MSKKAEKAEVVDSKHKDDFEPDKPLLIQLVCKKCGPAEYKSEFPPKYGCPKCNGSEVSGVHVF